MGKIEKLKEVNTRLTEKLISLETYVFIRNIDTSVRTAISTNRNENNKHLPINK